MIKSLFLAFIAIFMISCSSSNKPLPPKCYKLPAKGKCKAYFEKYYFNQQKNSCEKFVWGGCGGYIPFNSINECKLSCEGSNLR